MERLELSASVVKPRKISNIKHLKALFKPACKVRLQITNKYGAPDQKKRSGAPEFVCASCVRSVSDSQHNGKFETTLIRGNTLSLLTACIQIPTWWPGTASGLPPTLLRNGLKQSLRKPVRAFDPRVLVTFNRKIWFTCPGDFQPPHRPAFLSQGPAAAR
jgi:hypothetical protein